ncbi:MAG: polyprenyl diphosphate synthase [Spirochaetales bacterium]|nr:polyprenyl diphosphate synthase [Spirochaetales bacterium]
MTPSPDSLPPSHIGIIMDGNGRWATSKGLPRTAGHKEGLEAAKRIVAAASDAGVRTLSLYAFSTENWRRAEDEVSFLMGLICTHLRNQYDFYRERGLRVVHSGDLDGLPAKVRREIARVEKDTSEFTGMTVNLLINYGGRDEIIRAITAHRDALGPETPITEESLSNYLDAPQVPDMDLMIRTGGEMRLSNFHLWRAAYAEFYFSDAYWPDWNEKDFKKALTFFHSRQRRFGGVPK